MRDLAQEDPAQRDPLVRIARALELCAMTSVLKVSRASDVRECAWRSMRALVQEIEGDACGPQDVLGVDHTT